MSWYGTAILLASDLFVSEFCLLAAYGVTVTTVASSEPLTLTTSQLTSTELVVWYSALTELLWRFGF